MSPPVDSSRRSPLKLLALGALVALLGCGQGAVGAACDQEGCGEELACADVPFPGGYCTRDCSTSDCPAGSVCANVRDRSFCLRSCSDSSECREGYQCWQGACAPPCETNADCGRSLQCQGGACVPYAGAPIGGSCNTDEDCSTRLCLFGSCSAPCDRDSACPEGQTCSLNADGDTGIIAPYTTVRPACVQRRGGRAPGAACSMDDDCDRGSCQLGLCVELCASSTDCHTAGLACTKMYAPLDTGEANPYRGCLPPTGTLTFPIARTAALPLPGNAQALTLFVREKSDTASEFVGVTELLDPAGKVLYTQPMSEAEFYSMPVRYYPSGGVSTMLVPNSPSVTLGSGVYTAQFSGSGLLSQVSGTAFVKLGPAPISTGKLSLNFYFTDLGPNCGLTQLNAKTKFASAVNQIVSLYASVGVTVDPITYQSANGAANVVRVPRGPGENDPLVLEAILDKATGNQSTMPGMDIVMVRSITTTTGQDVGILGIAGGIPSAPLLGTPHSGAVVSADTFCGLPQDFGSTVAHEAGHTLGLFHNVEQTGRTDALPDTPSDGNARMNLMYWEERGGTKLTAQQGQVVRNDPKVRP